MISGQRAKMLAALHNFAIIDFVDTHTSTSLNIIIHHVHIATDV